MRTDKNGYEPIPDVEKGVVGEMPKATLEPVKYSSEFSSDQIELLSTLDTAISTGSGLDISKMLPEVDPSELITSGKSYVRSLITPTITALCSAAVALVLDQESQAVNGVNSWFAMIAPYFPYINAIVVGVAGLSPIQERVINSMSPVYDEIETVQDRVEAKVSDIKVMVDKYVDTIQKRLAATMEPIQPVFDKATKKEEMIQKLLKDDDLNVIPDPSDVQREIDEAQQVMGDKIIEAKEKLPDVTQYIPKYMRTAKSFYWHIVCPALILGLLFQVLVAYVTTQITSSSSSASQGNITLISTKNGLPIDNATITAFIKGSTTRRLAAVRKKIKDLAANSTDDKLFIDENMTETLLDLNTDLNPYPDTAYNTIKRKQLNIKNEVTNTAYDFGNELNVSAMEHQDNNAAYNNVTYQFKDKVVIPKTTAYAVKMNASENVYDNVKSSKVADTIKTEASREIKVLENGYDNITDTFKTEASGELKVLESDYSKMTDKLKTEASGSLKILENDYSNLTNTLKSKASGEVGVLTSDYSNMTDNLKIEASEEFKVLESEYKNVTDKLETESSREFKGLESDYKKIQHKFKTEASKELKVLGSDYNNITNKFKTEATGEFKVLGSDYSNMTNKFETEASEEWKVLESDFNSTTRDFARTYAKERSEAKEKLSQLKENLNTTFSELASTAKTFEENATLQMEAFKDQFNTTMYNIEEEIIEGKGQARAMLTNVLVSYLLTLLQLGVAYLVTNPKVKQWVIEKALSTATDHVKRSLEETKVVETVEDVLVVRFGRIRTKILNMITLYHKMKTILDKVDGLGIVSDKLNVIEDKIENITGGRSTSSSSIFGRFLKR